MIYQEPRYNVQCLAGHVYGAAPGSDLEKRCIAREEKGYLDALILDHDECSCCIEEHREGLRRELRMCQDIGCPCDDLCKARCLIAVELASLEN